MFFKKGFTLVELLVSISILSIGMFGVFQAFPLGTKIWKSSQRATLSSQLGQEKMEEIIANPYEEILIGTIELKHQLNPPFNFYQRETVVTCVDPNSDFSEVVNCSPDPYMKKIEISVFWKTLFGFSEESIKISSFITKK
ncbi:prepilin-type N-terminal cleavage/methylation domain-containing protein [Patescibacteria group bacterium]|nr:prepilin-type N-terminal cleavage/methylation domain-containing protein [Patescibacteria group bacterium]MBU1877171.1 prepilin-type N-terminal cleavage/methylation domain-containing protein [Patescibacteria group bacterium]